MRFSVVLNTYNRAHFLPRVLAAWTRIPAEEFTMIVADDGSEDGTEALLREQGGRLPYRLLHVRHERKGHRRAEILNKAAAHACDDAILFTDADSLPAANLLVEHRRAFRADRLLAGGYIRLSEEFTGRLDAEGAARGDHESQLTPALRRRLGRAHWKHRFYCWIRKRGRPHIMGLNMVIPRAGFLAVNGYDNEFRGWGRADGDLRERLKQVGVRPFSDWNRAIVFHLHHPPDPTKATRANVSYSERRSIPAVAQNGFEQCLETARSALIHCNRD